MSDDGLRDVDLERAAATLGVTLPEPLPPQVNALSAGFPESTDDIAAWFEPHEVVVATGVVAVITIDPHDGGLAIPWVRATIPGHGNVKAWLDGLPTNVPVRFIGVVNERLDGMLERRGFKRCLLPMPRMNGFVPSRVRRPDTQAPTGKGWIKIG